MAHEDQTLKAAGNAYRTGDDESAARILREAIGAGAGTPRVRARLARHLADMGDLTGARAELRALRGTEGPEVTYARAHVLARLHREEAAIRILNALVRDHPDYLPAWQLLSQIMEERGELDSAVHLLRTGMGFCKGPLPAILSRLGLLEEDRGAFEAAIECFSAALDVRKKDDHEGRSRNHLLLGIVLGKLGRREEGRAHLEAGLVLAPGETELLHGLGVSYRETDPAKAVSLLRQSLAADPGSHKTMTELGFALWRAGEAVESEALLKSVLRSPDTDNSILPEVYLGLLLQSAGRQQESELCYMMAARRYPAMPSAVWPLVLFLESTQRAEDAALLRRRALELERVNTEEMWNLMRLMWEAGSREVAAEMMQRQLASVPDYIYAPWVRATLRHYGASGSSGDGP